MKILHNWTKDPTDWRGYSMLGWPGHPDLDNWLDTILNNIPEDGDILICGTARGGDVMALRVFMAKPRHITVIDSFAGLGPSYPQDKGSILKEGDFSYSVQEYLGFFDKVNLQSPDEIHELFMTPENITKIPQRKVACLFIDVDQYAPAKTCYESFIPWVMPGGVILTHDYGFEGTPGVKIAAEEYAPGRWEQIYGSLWRLLR